MTGTLARKGMLERLRTDEPTVIRAWLPAGYVSVLLLLIVLGLGSYLNVRQIIEHTNWVRHTIEVQGSLDRVLADVSTAESQQRGYILNGARDYLDGYNLARKDALAATKSLQDLIADNPPQVRRGLDLSALVQERFQRLDMVITEYRQGGLQAARGLSGARGPVIMREIRSKIDEMTTAENLLLRQRNVARERSIQRAGGTFAFSGVLTLGLLTGLYVLLKRFLSEQLRARAVAELHHRELQKEIEEKERAERELQRSNRELQDFAFVASHDLQEPLRKIQAFGDRLRSKNIDNLDEASLDYLNRMLNAANRMQELINALLNLSRVTTKAQPFAPVNLNSVLSTVVEDLQRRLEESGGHVDVSRLPTIDADPIQMRQLFQNLIGNALKFRVEDRAPVVTLREAPADDPDNVRIVLSDNGIGFDNRHADKIFQVFQRLHGRGEYEGSGIGLAICRRIVDRHGGSIVATGVLGEGATFTIDLPKRQVEKGTA